MGPDQPRGYRHLIAGRDAEFGEDGSFARHRPSDGRLVAELADGGTEAVDAAVSAARACFDREEWRRRSGLERAEAIGRWAALLRHQVEPLARIEAEEVGKPIRFARADLEETAALIDYAGSLALHQHGRAYDNLGPEYLGLTLREPVGVVAAIVPWNVPSVIFAQKVPFALAAGCAVVVKPSEFAAGSLLELTRLAHQAGIPPEVLNLVLGAGPKVGKALVDHPLVDMISFTGSTAVGKVIAAQAGAQLKRCALELGGKGATVVFADADLESAVEGVLFGAYLNQGEICCAGSRLLVESEVAEQFSALLTERVGKLVVGDPFDEAADVGALIHRSHLEQVLSSVQAACSQGAELLAGGRQLTDGARAQGNYVEPAVLAEVPVTATAFGQEIFGPVLTVTRFDGPEDAVSLANATSFGLADGIWTSDIGTATMMARRLRTGTVWVNTSNDGALQLPFGGFKQSGTGREKGIEGFDEFTEIKSIQMRIGGEPLRIRERKEGAVQ